MTGKIFQVEIDIISKSVIIKAMIDGAFCTVFLICILVYMYMYTYKNTCTLLYTDCCFFNFCVVLWYGLSWVKCSCKIFLKRKDFWIVEMSYCAYWSLDV